MTQNESAVGTSDTLRFFHGRPSRSTSIHWLLEELGVPYELELVDYHAPGGVPESYRAIHPHKKVPAIQHRGVTLTERAAIAIYLADTFPAAGLAPALDDPRRGPYLKWLVYTDSVVDPCIAAKLKGWSYVSNDFSFGTYDDMVRNLEQTLASSPYVVGDRFTAADTQLAATMAWAIHAVDLLPRSKVFLDYLGRVQDRPGYRAHAAKERG